MNGLTEPFMIPYALALGASTFQAGLLSSARSLVVALIQLVAANAVAWIGSRRAVVLATVGLQVLMWLPIALVVPLLDAGAVWLLIGLYTVSTAGVGLGAPAWGSLISEYVPESERGAFFGHRARMAGLWTSIATLVAGGVLHATSDSRAAGFTVLCLLAAAARARSWRLLARHHEDPWEESPHLRFSFWRFIRQVPRSNFATFSCCLAFVNFGAHLAAPYFVVYQLEELGIGYIAYTVIALAGSTTGFLTSAWWGRIGDRVGNHAVLRWTTGAVAVLPVIWVVLPHPVALAAANALGAFLWAGLNLSATNFLYDAVSPPKRHTCLAYFNVLNGLAVAAGPVAGAWIVAHAPRLAGSTFAAVFLASVVVRAAGALTFHRLVREVRAVHPVGLREVMLDLAEEGMVQVLGLFSVAPEREGGAGPKWRGRWRRRGS